MAGRPSLRIGEHGKIRRDYLGGGVWLAFCRFRDTDGVTRRVQRVGPADAHDKRGKLGRLDRGAKRTPPASEEGPKEVGPDTFVMALVDQHLARLAADGRSAATLATYTFAANKLKKFLGGVRVREANTSRLDAALRSMREAHNATMAKQAKTILRGGLQLAVMANALPANPVRDVQPLRAKNQPKGATALTAEQLRRLLIEVAASERCREIDLADR